MFKRFLLLLMACGAMVAVVNTTAAANVSLHFKNVSNNCAWVTGYQHGVGIVWQIVKSGNVPPGADFRFGTYGDAKVRAEVYHSGSCGGKVIRDLDYVTNVHRDTLKLINGPHGLQIVRD